MPATVTTEPFPRTELGRLDDAVHRLVLDARDRAVPEVRRRLPARTGALRAGTRGRVSRTADGWALTISPSPKLFYARFVERGTGIYGPRGRRIKPRKARAFRIGGREVRSIAGQRAQHSFQRAYAETEPMVERLLTDADRLVAGFYRGARR